MLISQRPILTEEPISEFRSRFVLEPLEPGFGYTLGNSLRRTLLSSIPGASVTSIRIEGFYMSSALSMESKKMSPKSF